MKKLLGLLAVAPLSLAACGGAKSSDDIVTPQYELNEVRYSASNEDGDSQLLVSHIELSSATDADGFNAAGKAIREAYDAKPDYGLASVLKMTGSVNGVDFNKVVDFNGVKDNDGTDTPFTTLKGILDNDWVKTGELTTDGVMAKNLKEAGTHVVPITVADADYHAFEDELTEGRESLSTTMTQADWTTEFHETDSVIDNYDINDLSEWTGISAADETTNITAFDDTYFVFEKYFILTRHDRLIMYYHHEANPNASWYASWTIDFAAA